MINASADLRYLRQNYELRISLPGTHISMEDIATIQTQFHESHKAEYGHSTSGEIIQMVYLRMQAMIPLTKPDIKPLGVEYSETIIATSDESRFIWFPGGKLKCQVYQRDALKPGHTLEGPAIIQEKEATTLVEKQWHLKVDQFGNLAIEKDQATTLS